MRAQELAKSLTRRRRHEVRNRFYLPSIESLEHRLALATVLAVTDDNVLLRFDSASPATILSSTPITGLSAFDNVSDIDFRPADGRLYAFVLPTKLYTIDPTTGVATYKATLSENPLQSSHATAVGIDFDPVGDALRVVTDDEQNFRVNADTGLVTVDSDLSPINSRVLAAAYTNSFAGATTTTLFDIDIESDTLRVQNPPNSGTLTDVGSGLGVGDLSPSVSFDIQPQGGGADLALGAANRIGIAVPQLFSVNLATGAGTLIGNIGARAFQIRGLAIVPEPSALTLKKLTNGADNNTAPGPFVAIGSTVAFTYIVDNSSATPLASVSVVDDNGTPTDPSDDFNASFTTGDNNGNGLLDQLETWNFTATRIATAGQHTNTARASGAPASGPIQVAIDIDNHFGSSLSTNIFAVDSSNNLLRFNSATPGTIVSSKPVVGLAAGETVLGIDFRPATGVLYAVGSSNRLYTINQATGVATQVGSTGEFTLSGAAFGFDFNPTVDRLRVVSDADQNLRLDPNSGTLMAVDTALAYTSADPNAGTNPDVVGLAYTNSVNGAAATTLYGIDANLNILVIQNPPNDGTLSTVGPLGVDVSEVLGFDIRAATGAALASLVVGGVTGLYQIDLQTGAATLVGQIGSGLPLRGMAIAPEGFAATTFATNVNATTITFNGTAACDSIVFDASNNALRHNRFSAGDPGFVSDLDFDPQTPGEQSFSINPVVPVTIIVNGGGCDDVVTLGTPAAPAATLAIAFQINGQGGGDSLIIDNSTYDGIAPIIKGDTNSIVGATGNNGVMYSELEKVSLTTGPQNDFLTILGVQNALMNISTGGGNDSVKFGAGASLSGGLLDGGTGNNTLDYASYTTPVAVDLATSQTLFQAILSGAQEPGPLSSSPASGIGVYTLNNTQTALAFQATYSDLTGASLTGAHFHNAPRGVNGPIVRGIEGAELHGATVPSGTLSGVWTSTDAQPLTTSLAAELVAGRIYTNIHSNLFPSGEIRGQLANEGTVNPATGTGGIRGFTTVIRQGEVDLSVSKSDSPDPVQAGQNITYLVSVTNNGFSTANATFTDVIPANTTFVSFRAQSPWNVVTTPPVGGTGTITATNSNMETGTFVFELVVHVNTTTPVGTTITNTATVSSIEPDANPSNNSGVATTAVNALVDLSVTTTDSPDPVIAGTNLTYTLTVVNSGAPVGATLSDAIPANTTFVSFAAPPGWTTTTPPVGAAGTLTATNPNVAGDTTAVFMLVVHVNASTPGVTLTNVATVSTTVAELNTANNTDTETTTVGAQADLSVVQTDSPDPVSPGSNITYTLTVANSGSSDAQNVTLTDVIPTDTTFVSFTAPAGWTNTTPPVGGTGAISSTLATLAVGASATFTLVVQVDSGATIGETISNTAAISATTTDVVPGNNSATSTTVVDVDTGPPECNVKTLNEPGNPGTALLVDDADNPGDAVLIVTGTNRNDVIVVEPQPKSRGIFRVVQNKRVIVTFISTDVPRIVVFGLAGNDTIVVNGSMTQSAKLFGNEGNDVITGGRGDDGIDGGAGNDKLFGNAGNDTLCGGTCIDQVFGGLGDDTVGGDAGNDKLFGEAGNDLIISGDGNDFLYGGIGNDRLYGQAGNDQLFGDAGNDVVVGGDGSDILHGGAGGDVLIGGTGKDTLYGDAGDDVLISGSTTNDEDDAALQALLAAWAANDSFENRMNNVRTFSGPGTITDDGVVDTLYGGSNQDWFIGGSNDKIKDRAKNEPVN